jgi:hypothetical protein
MSTGFGGTHACVTGMAIENWRQMTHNFPSREANTRLHSYALLKTLTPEHNLCHYFFVGSVSFVG